MNRRKRLLWLGGETYAQKIKKLFGTSLIAYWPLNETSGTAAVDASGNGRNGTYTGVDLANAAGPTKTRTRAPYFDGANDYVNIQSASLAAAFSGVLGTMGIWCKLNGAWNDPNRYHALRFLADANNYVHLEKSLANTWEWRMIAGGNTTASINSTTPSTLGAVWFLSTMTWTKAGNEFKAYLNDAQIGVTKTIPGAWAGAPATSLIGAAVATPTYPMNGWLAYAFLLNRVATLAEVAQVYNLGA